MGLKFLSSGVALAGIAATTAFAAQAVLSWFLAPLAHYDVRTVAQYEFFARLGDAIPSIRGNGTAAVSPLQRALEQSLHAQGVFESKAAFVFAYAVPQLLVTAAALWLIWMLSRHREHLTADVPKRLWRWAIVFAAVSVFAVPVLVPDFWMSIAWGRSLAAGINPYYEVPLDATSGLPLNAPLMKMTYGPLWAYLSAAVTWLTRGDVLWGAVFFKLVLAGAWIALLWLVRSLLRDRLIFEQALGLVMVGWLPLGVTQTVGEGHNDVAMVACVLLWLYWRGRGNALSATLALAASVLFKYASAPLFLVDLLYREPDESTSPSRFAGAYVSRGAAALAVLAVGFAPLFRGMDFFASTREAYRGHFFLPADAVLAIGGMSGLNLRFVAYAIEAIFPALTLLALYRYLRIGAPRLLETAAAVMLTMVLTASGHLWPWYLLWFTAVAATIPLTAAGRLALGLTIVMPFPLLVWTVAPHSSDFARFHLPSLVAYSVALAWFLAVRFERQGTFGAGPFRGTGVADLPKDTNAG
jgi:alpha-1,6-mannosyltransferase